MTKFRLAALCAFSQIIYTNEVTLIFPKFRCHSQRLHFIGNSLRKVKFSFHAQARQLKHMGELPSFDFARYFERRR